MEVSMPYSAQPAPTREARRGLFELTAAARAELAGSKYFNKSLAPTSVAQRNWSTYNIASLWIGMSVCLPAFTMASGLVAMGLSPWMAVLNVALGNLIILIPIQLNSHVGTKYGIPFPVFARMTFGTVGAHIPSLSRAVTACGWNAIQSWFGGGALVAMASVFVPSIRDMDNAHYVGFFVFLALACAITAGGAGSIKIFEAIGAPVLIILTFCLFVWSFMLAGNGDAAGNTYTFGDVIRAASDTALIEANGGFWYIFMAGLTSSVAFWATMALNIPDFSRYASSQSAQFKGQLFGMPITMAVCAFVGAFFAQATKLVNLGGNGLPIFDPTEALNHIDRPVITFLIGFGVVIATVTTNIAANIVAPANGFSNLWPKRISYRLGALISCAIAVLYRPWWILSDAGNYIIGWLNVYGGILAPIAAIFIADYYIVKKREADVMSLYQGKSGKYWYTHGLNMNAVAAWICGFILPTIGSATALGSTGLFKMISANAYIFGFAVGFIVYLALEALRKKPAGA
jgi:NCS1 family nucleobase:cation symporter-1